MNRLKAGDRFPEFTVNTAFESDVNLNELMRGKRTLLRVLRYVGCPTCRIDMHVLAEAYARFEERNAQIIVVLQSDQKHLQDALSMESLPFTIISDPEETIYHALDIPAASDKEAFRGGADQTAWAAKRKAADDAGYAHGDSEGNELQLPAMFVIEPDGFISYAHYAESCADLPMAEESLKILDDTAEYGVRLQTGDIIPDFRIDTQNGHHEHFHELLKGKTVLWVLRYIGCTVCRFDVHMIAKRYEEFKNRNVQVFVVMQSDTAHLKNDLESSGTVLPFEIIADPGEYIYQRLNIVPAESMDALRGNGADRLKEKAAAARAAGFAHGDYEGNEQQLPALFILDENGKACFAHYASELMDMPSVDEVLNLLETLG